MRFTAGACLGHFEILAPLGAGGMGEVYRARDTRLDRTVAIKLLPRELVDAPSRRVERFHQEARAIARITHPNICTLHDVGEDGAALFLVMEYVEGETLARRLEEGPLPLPLALRVAIGIADALDHAHRHGVVHRDLKPSNIMLTRDSVKLLDFGLAKLRGTGRGRADRRDQKRPDRRRHHRGHHPVHGPRADRRTRSGCAHRHLLVRRRALRNALRAPAVRGRQPRLGHGRHRGGRTAGAVAAAAANARVARAADRSLPGETPRTIAGKRRATWRPSCGGSPTATWARAPRRAA